MPVILAGRPAITLNRIPGIDNKVIPRQEAEEIIRHARAGKRAEENVREALVTFAHSGYLNWDDDSGDETDEEVLRANEAEAIDQPSLPLIARERLPVVLRSKGSNHVSPACAADYVDYPLPPASLLEPDPRLGLPEGTHLASPSFALVLLARHLDWAATLVCAIEFCGTYDLARDFTTPERYGGRPILSDMPPAVTPADLRAFVRALPSGIAGLPNVRIASDLAVAGSASPIESRLYTLLSGSVRRGGYGLRNLELNPTISLTREEAALLGSRTMRIDVLSQSAGVGIEYDSRLWHEINADPTRIRRDKKRIDIAHFHGIDLLPLTADMLNDLRVFETFAASLKRLMGKSVHRLSARTLRARRQLHRRLFSPSRVPA